MIRTTLNWTVKNLKSMYDALEDTAVSDNTDNEVPTETESGESILVESESA